MKAVLSTRGIEESLEALAQTGANLDAAIPRALRAGGQALVDGMQRRAPVKTGDLKSHIGMTEVKSDGNFFYIVVGLYPDGDLPAVPQPKRSKSQRERMYHGIYQEYGRPGMDAHPFIRPTIKSDMGKARRAMIESFKQEMSR